MNYLLDTNVISELIAKQPTQKILDWLDSLDPTTIYLSVITLGEIRKGIEKLPPSKRKVAIRTWLETDLLLRFQGKVLDITVAIMLIWGELTGRLENEGKPIAALDALLAATALQGGFRLVTRNDSDFQHTGVALLNPWKEI
jgi:predicted nucleic acid-binding protein